MRSNGEQQQAMSGRAGNEREYALPQETKAYRRHLKRRVQGAVHRFAAVAPPELRNLCMAEVQGLGLGDPALSEAGVEFSGSLADCYSANLWLRTASRVLCRVQEFRAGAVEDLFRHASSFRWELWLSHRLPVRAEGHVFNSRIQSSSLVEATLRAAIGRRFQDVGLTPPPSETEGTAAPASEPGVLTQRLIVHLARNRCQVSIDTTGAHLHERGYRLRHTGAPLRETLASGILMKCGWKGETPLIDGMTGSGTLATEGALISRRLAPGIGRRFLFESWPSFNDRLMGYLRKQAFDHARPRVGAPIIGIDGDLEAVNVARDNAERAGVGDSIQWMNRDFFGVNPMELSTSPGLLTLNPPYGRRLKGQDRGVYEKIGVHLRHQYVGWQVAILAPEEPMAMALKLRSAKYWRIRHGGHPVWVVMARI